MKIAVLTSHGQPSAPAPAEQALAALAKSVAGHLPGWDIRSATLATPGRLEEVMEAGAKVYPFFMTDGWFTTRVLPARLEGRAPQILPPFGLDPDLPALTAQILQRARQAREIPVRRILLAAHGSARGPKAAQAAESFAKSLRQHLTGIEVVTSYIEEAPFVAEMAKRLDEKTICLPFFAQSGDHVTQDIPEALAEAEFKGQLLPALGAAPEIPALIAAALRQN